MKIINPKVIKTKIHKDPRGSLQEIFKKKQFSNNFDFALFVSSIIPMFMFGFIFGNLLMGMPFSFDPIYLRSYYSGNFWMELNWIGILSGLVSVCILAMHGCSYICLRTEGEVRENFQKKQAVFGVLFLILFTAT